MPGCAQGTAATAVAGVYGALRVQGKSNKELAKQRIVLVGAGSAGTGVARMLALGMVKQVGSQASRALSTVVWAHGLLAGAVWNLTPDAHQWHQACLVGRSFSILRVTMLWPGEEVYL